MSLFTSSSVRFQRKSFEGLSGAVDRVDEGNILAFRDDGMFHAAEAKVALVGVYRVLNEGSDRRSRVVP